MTQHTTDFQHSEGGTVGSEFDELRETPPPITPSSWTAGALCMATAAVGVVFCVAWILAPQLGNVLRNAFGGAT